MSQNRQLTMTSNVPKRNKADILLSSVHHDVSIIEDDALKRPEIIHLYNKTKIGVDLVNQMVQTYTCRRATRRWPFAIFCNMLDIAALNAYTVQFSKSCIRNTKKAKLPSVDFSLRNLPKVSSCHI